MPVEEMSLPRRRSSSFRFYYCDILVPMYLHLHSWHLPHHLPTCGRWRNPPSGRCNDGIASCVLSVVAPPPPATAPAPPAVELFALVINTSSTTSTIIVTPKLIVRQSIVVDDFDDSWHQHYPLLLAVVYVDILTWHWPIRNEYIYFHPQPPVMMVYVVPHYYYRAYIAD